MQKYFPIIISLCFFTISILCWDKINLPYDEDNQIIGEYYLNKTNPQNDLIRFIFFIIPSSLVYLISYLKINKSTYNFNRNSKNYFLSNKLIKKENKDLNNYFFFFIILVLLEFLSIDFKKFLAIDLFHDAVFLVPPINYLTSGEFFQSTLYDYGYTGNNLGLIINYFFGFYTLGAIDFLKLLLILFIKISLIFIAKKLTEYLECDDFLKKLFFIIFAFFVISLPNYYDLSSHFSPRSALYLFTVLLIGSALTFKRYSEVKYFFIGSLSLISLFWWFDIGFYINFLIFLLSLYLIVHSQKKNLSYLIFGFLFSWIVFLALIPSEEIKSFFGNIKFILSTTDYLIGVEYLKPFSENSTRWTKALIIIFLSCILLINLNFSKKFKVHSHLKLYLNLIFISGIIVFKSALTRSDVYHLKYSSGLYTLVFAFAVLFVVLTSLIERKNINAYFSKLNREIKKRLILAIIIIFSFLFLGGYLNNKNQNSIQTSLINLANFKINIEKLVLTNSLDLLNDRNLAVLNKYKTLSSNDTCIQNFSDDNFFPFFLKKPTCTKFYLSNQILSSYSESQFILEFQESMPNVILYESPTKLLFNYDNLQNAMKFVRDNYEFYENYYGFVFYKKIDN